MPLRFLSIQLVSLQTCAVFPVQLTHREHTPAFHSDCLLGVTHCHISHASVLVAFTCIPHTALYNCDEVILLSRPLISPEKLVAHSLERSRHLFLVSVINMFFYDNFRNSRALIVNMRTLIVNMRTDT